MFPSECVLERRVRSDGDKELADPSLPLFILKCEHRKADRYELDPYDYNQTLQGMVIGVCLADAPAAVSYLVILGAGVYAQIAAVDKTLIVIKLSFAGTGGRLSYLIYDAVALSLRLIPLQPRDPNWAYTLSYNISIARPYQGDATYALVHTGQLAGPEPQEGDSLYLWRPSSSSSPPWSERKQCSFPEDWITNKIDMEFSFYGQAYWVDLVCGVSFCCCDALFDDNSGPAVQFGFIPLPLEERGHYRNLKLLAQPSAYRTMGVVSDSFIRFVSIDGFMYPVKLKNRTVTVWKLSCDDQDDPWELEHEFSLKMLWGFEGFADLPKDLTPMYPLLSTKDTDVIYLALGECFESIYKSFRKFIPCSARYLLAIDMQKKIVTSVPLAHWIPDQHVSCGFSRYLRDALVGPCNDEGIPSTKDEPRLHGGEAPNPQYPIPTEKKNNKRRR
ncbi:uncharacterized protein [Lolium perenne]|uniref:uncharacterized protein isoform X1 n=1 Tax=Lolium perenne TaxID=4522 RepID=UPI0021EB43D0|nr:uncharacterized protein LOC127348270 isoform X1 [Lolium perenne]